MTRPKSNRKNKLILKYPSSVWGARWKEALPSGNGSIGAAVYGGTYEETVMISHEDLWWQTTTPEMPDVSDKLAEVRQLLMADKAVEADQVYTKAFQERGYSPSMGCPLPLGDLKIYMPGKQAFKAYSRSLDMETGEVVVSWKDGETQFERALFVSRKQDIVVCEIRSSGSGTIESLISLDIHDRNDARTADNRVLSPLPQNMEMKVELPFIQYAASNDDGTDFGAVARVIPFNGQALADLDGLRVSNADCVLIIIKPFIKRNRVEAWLELSNELLQMEDNYEQLFIPHAAEHGAIFGAMTFDIEAEDQGSSNEELLLEAYQGEAPAALMEKMWAYGRYLLISSSREGGHPCSLMGLWCGEYSGYWAFNMVNENLQMNYWQALSGNMPELLLAVFDYFDRLIDDFKENARKLFNCRGIYIPAPTAPDSGLLKTLYPHIIYWTGGAGWVAQHYYDYYLHTGDLVFLKQRALPFLRETALFYLDFFTIGADGFFISSPSNSPENTPGNYWKEELKDGEYEGVVMETTINATMDFAIAKEVFTHLIEGSKITGFHLEEITDWEANLKRIPDYQINEDGAVKEWMHPYFTDNYHHRHQSHLYPVFPGTEVTRENNPELYEAFIVALNKRLIIGLKQQSGWSLAHMANIFARMGDGERAIECLDILSRSCLLNNFYTLSNDWRGMGIGMDMGWAPFQIDANMGWSAAIQEMLVFSVPGTISILPAIPKRWRKGSAGPLLARGGIEILLSWDQRAGTIDVELLSKGSDQEIQMVLNEAMLLDQGANSSGLSKSFHLFLVQGIKQTFNFRNSESFKL
ncbi:glycoside hydrolase family 95 protein [Paenibacillus psychroresistens]|uniref:Glycoside hydrolase family 95 protein n=1 Tax=Paenibacillus psychroresistens TaxID=1778678 RepID=A0A6B8RTC5_9BACL|nr:glycoside hydrolase N-terminal domain-containing protein [Paenibacillus psychroresistens]QGQ99169.1 glycoside hydrolase family 95 protein [Paenibacillus psychroresistens]